MKGYVTEAMKTDLLREFTAEEVRHAFRQMLAFRQMHPSKVPSPNGMSPLFYQRYLHIMGPTTTKAVLEALNTGHFPLELNHTFITFILKRERPITLANFHHINLYNVLYKLISKIIANRFKLVLLLLISKSQSTFIPGR